MEFIIPAKDLIEKYPDAIVVHAEENCQYEVFDKNGGNVLKDAPVFYVNTETGRIGKYEQVFVDGEFERLKEDDDGNPIELYSIFLAPLTIKRKPLEDVPYVVTGS